MLNAAYEIREALAIPEREHLMCDPQSGHSLWFGPVSVLVGVGMLESPAGSCQSLQSLESQLCSRTLEAACAVTDRKPKATAKHSGQVWARVSTGTGLIRKDAVRLTR